MSNNVDDLNQPFKVFVRLRPLTDKEETTINNNSKKLNKNFISVFDNQVN